MGLLASTVLCGACLGEVGTPYASGPSPAASPSGPPASGDAGVAPPGVCATPDVNAAPLRRLTRREYDRTVADLLGDERGIAQQFVPEAAQFGFDNNAEGGTLSPLIVEQFETAAIQLAERAVVDLPRLMGCDPAADERACVSSFVTSFGRRAFRRPLRADEQQRYLTFYDATRADSTVTEAVRLVLEAMLQSPHFLYRLEFGMPTPGTPDAVPLTPHELASRLSYFFWGSMPDETLLSAADRGELNTPQQIRAQAERLLSARAGAEVVRDFFRQWASSSNLAAVERDNPELTPQIRALLAEETAHFADQVVRSEDGRLSTLLTSPHSYMNAELASYYGVTGPRGATFSRVSLDPARYGGLLTHGGIQALWAHPRQSSPVLRGKFVLDRLLCAPPPAPPNNVNTTLPPVDPEATAREQLQQLTGGQPCASCHQLLNPPGFAFEHFDEIGRWRDDERGLPIDASGTLVGHGAFDDHIDLVRLLSRSERVRDCMVLQWFRYAHGRDRGDSDRCSMEQLGTVFEQSDGNIRTLLLALTETSAFRQRNAFVGGGP